MKGVVVEEQLEQVVKVKVNCLYVQDVSQQANAVALINARATGQSKLASSVATCNIHTTTTVLGQRMFDACTHKLPVTLWLQTLYSPLLPRTMLPNTIILA